ncbi:MAG: hypothetical protein FWD47_15360 [Treponema sp.]|nr:hypothetical protein [Treponema sp.]
MHNIILMGSYHADKGNCNHTELLRIIENIKPDVIFEEKPSLYYDFYYKDKTRSCLESDAINLYLENNSLIQILVDDEVILPENSKYLYEQIEKRSGNYRNLIDTNSYRVSKYGFKYLNSVDYLNYHQVLENEIEETLKFINNDKLFLIRKAWLEWEEKRDNEMMKKIYNYSKSNNYNIGIFLVGAAHRASIIKKIPVYNTKESKTLNWNYSEYEDINKRK